MRNLLFVLWLFTTMFIMPMVEFVIGYTEWARHTYDGNVLGASALFTFITSIFVAYLLYEPKEVE